MVTEPLGQIHLQKQFQYTVSDFKIHHCFKHRKSEGWVMTPQSLWYKTRVPSSFVRIVNLLDKEFRVFRGWWPFSILSNSPNALGDGYKPLDIYLPLVDLIPQWKLQQVIYTSAPYMHSRHRADWLLVRQKNYLWVLETILLEERLFSKAKLGHAGAIGVQDLEGLWVNPLPAGNL